MHCIWRPPNDVCTHLVFANYLREALLVGSFDVRREVALAVASKLT